MVKKMLSLMFVCLMAICLMAPVYAADNVRPGEAVNGGAVTSDDASSYQVGQDDDGESGSTSSISDKVNEVTNDLIDTSVTTDDIVDRLNTKGNDVVIMLQTIGKYVCIAGFVVCCILAVIGIIGNKRLLTGALIGLVISGVAYAGIVCGREIVNWIANWAIS